MRKKRNLCRMYIFYFILLFYLRVLQGVVCCGDCVQWIVGSLFCWTGAQDLGMSALHLTWHPPDHPVTLHWHFHLKFGTFFVSVTFLMSSSKRKRDNSKSRKYHVFSSKLWVVEEMPHSFWGSWFLDSCPIEPGFHSGDFQEPHNTSNHTFLPKGKKDRKYMLWIAFYGVSDIVKDIPTVCK